MLKEILEDIEKNKEMATRDLTKVDASIFTTMSGKKRRAKENLKELYHEYKNELKTRISFIMVNGKGCKKFAEVTAEEFAGVVQPAEGFYEDIVGRINPANYKNKTLNNSIVDILASYLEDKAHEVGVLGYPALVFSDKYAKRLNNKEDLVEVFTRMINDNVGAEFVGADLLEKAAIEAVNKNFAGRVLPIVVYSTNNELIDVLSKTFYEKLTPKVFKVSAGVISKKDSEDSVAKVTGKINKKSVKEALEIIRDQV